MSLSKRGSYNALKLLGDPERAGITKPPPKRQRSTERIPEWREQEAVIDWWRSYCRTVQLDERLLMAIPNGSFLRGGMEERKLQLIILSKTGTRKGAPDLLLAVPKSGRAGLFVEMKAADGRTSVDQDEFMQLLESKGYRTAVAYGALEAIEVIRGYVES